MNFNNIIMEIKRGENFKLLGRPYYVDDVPMLSWSNSGIEFDGRFDRIVIYFGNYACAAPVMFKTIVDGHEVKTAVKGEGITATIEGLRDKNHTVKILRISEGDTLCSIQKVQVYGAKPEITMPEEKKCLKLEFIGDSITAGYGVLSGHEQNVYTTFEQDSTMSYAYLTAKSLGAEIRTECWSGQGIVHSCGELVGTRFGEFFKYTARGEGKFEYVRDDYIPDVFIINGGTNDKKIHVTHEEFVEAALNFLSDVRKMYPDTPIIWMYGAMVHVFDDAILEAVNKFNAHDKNTYSLIVKSIYDYKNQTGANGHPNVNASIRCAGILKRKINEVLGNN